MEILGELLIDLILEGSIGAVGSKKVPKPIRILAAVILALVFGGLIVGLFAIGISEKNWIMIIIAGVIAISIGIIVWKAVKINRRGKRS